LNQVAVHITARASNDRDCCKKKRDVLQAVDKRSADARKKVGVGLMVGYRKQLSKECAQEKNSGNIAALYRQLTWSIVMNHLDVVAALSARGQALHWPKVLRRSHFFG
jgi:hypothetical protein